MKQLAEALPNTLQAVINAEQKPSTSPHGLIKPDGLTTTRNLPSLASAQDPHGMAQRAMNAVLWLASPEQNGVGKLMTQSHSYAMTYNAESGKDEFAPTGAAINLDVASMPSDVAKRTLAYCEPATSTEITFQLARLLLHRKKAGLGEATMPMFLQDLSNDLRRLNMTSLGMAALVDHLRTNPRTPWFPDWPEIEAAANGIEASVTKAIPLLHAKAEAKQIAGPVG